MGVSVGKGCCKCSRDGEVVGVVFWMKEVVVGGLVV